MTVLSVTAANVVQGAGAVTVQGIAGETITAGQAVYRDPTTRKFLKSDADSATAAAHVVDGIALNGGGANQPILVQTAGVINLGATLVVGEIYVLDTTAGGIAPRADLASTEYVVVIGVAQTAANLLMGLINPAVALA